MLDPEFTASIKRIDERGEVTVAFSQAVLIPENYTSIDERFLSLKVIPKVKDTDLNKNISEWAVTQFSETQMTLKVNFTSPEEISIRSVSGGRVTLFRAR